jgi:hypothetical protein
MGVKHEQQLHVMISRVCDQRINIIAEAEGLKKSELVRRLLLEFVRSYELNDSRLSQTRPSTKILGTGVVPVRYKMP